MSYLVPRKLSFLSLVIPIYNEEASLPLLRDAIDNWVATLNAVETEIVLIDDGSKDSSLMFCKDWAQQCSAVRVISFSRNFGHQAAVSAGLRYASGEAVVIMDADLQDPLDTINEMVIRYEEGYDIAYGQRISRAGETHFKLVSAWLFYRLMRRCIHRDFPVDTGDFRLVSRMCVDVINSMPESHRFLRGMFAWTGFNQIAVFYARRERQAGETKYPLCKMLRLAWSGITAFSSVPIHAIALVGFTFAGLGFIACLYALWSWAMMKAVPGWTSLMGLVSLMCGVILVGIGVVGEYIAKIYEEVKHRPLYIVQRTINTTSPGQSTHGN